MREREREITGGAPQPPSSRGHRPNVERNARADGVSVREATFVE
jgi:hypothetical protein